MFASSCYVMMRGAYFFEGANNMLHAEPCIFPFQLLIGSPSDEVCGGLIDAGARRAAMLVLSAATSSRVARASMCYTDEHFVARHLPQLAMIAGKQRHMSDSGPPIKPQKLNCRSRYHQE